jgi:hypothetical protein
MAKQGGLGDNLYVAGYDLSGDIGSLSRIGGGPSPLEVTAIDKSAMERIGGKRDGGIEYSAYFNPSTGQAHERLSALPTGDVIMTYCRGTALGSPAAAMVAKQINYDGSRGDDGSLTFAVQAQANGFGLEWGRQLTAGKRTDSTGTTGASVDLGVGSTLFGLQAYLQVFAFTGTSVTVKLQESSNDGAGDAFADVAGGAFAAATAITSERIATAAGLTVERYLRVVTTGTFSNAVFSVTVVRNDVLTAF